MILVCGDTHVPFHEPKAVSALLGFLKRNQKRIDRLILLGDMADFYTISRWRKDPKRQLLLQDEMDLTAKLLKDIRAAYKGPINYLEGNHEDRLTKYLFDKAPQAGTLRDMSVPGQFRLGDLGIQWVPSTEDLIIGGLRYTHGDQIQGTTKYGAAKLLEVFQVNVMGGHIHRPDFAFRRSRAGVIRGWIVPCLCDLKPSYVMGVSNWAHGFNLVHDCGGSYSRFHVETVMIDNGKVVY